MAKVIWTKRAFSQLERNIKFIKEDRGIQFAEMVLNRTLSSTKLLESSPNIGTIEPKLAHKTSEYRFLIVYRYKIITGKPMIKRWLSREFSIPPEILKS